MMNNIMKCENNETELSTSQWSSKGLTYTTDPTLAEVCPCLLWTLQKIRWCDRRVISHKNPKKTHNINPFIVFAHIGKRKQQILLIVRVALTIEFLLCLHLFFNKSFHCLIIHWRNKAILYISCQCGQDN